MRHRNGRGLPGQRLLRRRLVREPRQRCDVQGVIAATAKSEIFIGSPSDPSGKCASGTGKFTGAREFKVVNEAKSPASLLIEMYGVGPFELGNGSTLEGTIFAPEAEVNINGGTNFKGGILGNKVHLEAGAGIFEWSEEVLTLTNGEAGAHKRKGWEQCSPGGRRRSLYLALSERQERFRRGIDISTNQQGALMPRIIVTTDPTEHCDAVLLDERVCSSHLASDHSAAQLIQRLGWAINDAEDTQRVEQTL